MQCEFNGNAWTDIEIGQECFVKCDCKKKLNTLFFFSRALASAILNFSIPVVTQIQ